MFTHTFLALRSAALFAPLRWGHAISAGLMFGHLVAFAALFARDLSLAKRTVWPLSLRVVVAIAGGVTWGTLAWWAQNTLLLAIVPPAWPTLLFGGLGLSLGFVLCGLSNGKRNAVIASLLVSLGGLFGAIYITHQQFHASRNTAAPAQALLYFQVDNPEHIWFIGLPFAFVIVAFSYVPVLWSAMRRR